MSPPIPTRRGLAWRALALEATWTADRMQGWGVLFTLLPQLRAARDRSAALVRHAAPFGCNPWMAPAVLAAMAKLEAEERGEDAVRLRDRVAPPLSAAGDLLVWRAMRPMALALAVLGVLVGRPLAGLLIAFVLHDGALVATWRRNWTAGLRLGAALESDIAAVRPAPRIGRTLQTALGCLAGALAGWGMASGWSTSPSGAFLMSAALVVGYHAARRQTPSGLAYVGWVLLASLLGRFSNPLGLP
jgi:hypothetical protein